MSTIDPVYTFPDREVRIRYWKFISYHIVIEDPVIYIPSSIYIKVSQVALSYFNWLVVYICYFFMIAIEALMACLATSY